MWGAVVNLSRNFARQSLMWLPASKARVAVRWAMAAPFLLKCHLRVNADVVMNTSHILSPEVRPPAGRPALMHARMRAARMRACVRACSGPSRSHACSSLAGISFPWVAVWLSCRRPACIHVYMLHTPYTYSIPCAALYPWRPWTLCFGNAVWQLKRKTVQRHMGQ